MGHEAKKHNDWKKVRREADIILDGFVDIKEIEEWFDEGEEFLFFSNPEELDTIIKDVLDNPDKYRPMIDKTYDKAINNYTTKHFVEKYLGKDE